MNSTQQPKKPSIIITQDTDLHPPRRAYIQFSSFFQRLDLSPHIYSGQCHCCKLAEVQWASRERESFIIQQWRSSEKCIEINRALTSSVYIRFSNCQRHRRCKLRVRWWCTRVDHHFVCMSTRKCVLVWFMCGYATFGFRDALKLELKLNSLWRKLYSGNTTGCPGELTSSALQNRVSPRDA